MTSKPNRGRRVLLGEITTVHGVRGDVVIRAYTGNPRDIAAYGALERADGTSLPRISVVRVTDRGVIARLEGVSDRNIAETFRGTELWVKRERLPKAADGEFYHADLIGLTARTPEGDVIGEIIAVENFGAGDLLEIRIQDTRQTEYIPFTNDFVPAIDLEAGTATVVVPKAGDDDEEPPGEDEEPPPAG